MSTEFPEGVPAAEQQPPIERKLEPGDLAKIEAAIAERLKGYRASTSFTLAQMEDLTGESTNSLLYLERKDEFLSPVFERKGQRQERRKYALTDLKKALFVAELRKRNFSVGACIAAWHARSHLTESAYSESAALLPVTHAGMNHVQRTQVQVMARLLQILLEVICDAEAVPGALIMVERFRHDSGQLMDATVKPAKGSVHLQVMRQSEGAAASLLRQTPRIPIGWSTTDGEVFVRFQDPEHLHKVLPVHDLFCVVMPARAGSDSYEVTLGIDKYSTDVKLRDIIEMLARGYVNLPADRYALIQVVLPLLWDVVLQLEARVDEGTASTLRRNQSDMLTVFANLVVAADPAWDYCAIMEPQAEHSDGLAIAAASSSFPTDMRGGTTYLVEYSLPGWVYRFRSPLFVNEVVQSDPRVFAQAFERPTAVAAVPACVDDDSPVGGVLYVGSRKSREIKEDIFDETGRRLLSSLGRLAGEILARSDMTRKTVRSAIRSGIFMAPETKSVEDLAGILGGYLETLEHLPSTELADRYVVLFAVRVGSFDELRPSSIQVAEWVMSTTMTLTYDFLSADLRTLPNAELTMLKLGSDREDSLAACIIRADSDLRPLRQKLADHLGVAAYLGMRRDPKVMVWSLPFSLRELRRKCEQNGTAVTVDNLVGRIYGALKVLPSIHQGDTFLRGREWAKALLQYELAHHHDPENPYHLRHIGQCCIRLARYEDAAAALNEALALDPGYPGTYRWLGELCIDKLDYAPAIAWMEKAIELDRRSPDLHRRLGEILALRGEPGDTKKAVDEFKEAMVLDKPEETVQALYLAYIARTYANVAEFEQALSWYEQALALDPTNGIIEFELRLMKSKPAAKRKVDAKDTSDAVR